MLRRLAHAAMPWAQRLRRLMWFFSRPNTFGVHAIPLTPSGKLVLVKLSYEPGWRLPGGGRKAGEEAEQTVLRELREEIGLSGHSELLKVTDFGHRPDYRTDRSSLFVLKDVAYSPIWSIEIKAVAEFDLDDLPPDTAPIARRLIGEASHLLRQ